WLPFHGPIIMKEPNETVEAFRRRTQEYWGLLEWIEYTADRFHAHTVLIEAKGPGLSAAQALQSRRGQRPSTLVEEDRWAVRPRDTPINPSRSPGSGRAKARCSAPCAGYSCARGSAAVPACRGRHWQV